MGHVSAATSIAPSVGELCHASQQHSQGAVLRVLRN